MSTTCVPKLQRQHDIFRMDVALASNKFKPASLKRINYCWLYLNVTLMSDITTPDGSRLDKAAYTGDRAQLMSDSPGHSVNQVKPNNKAWQDWKKFLHLLVHRDCNHTLKTPLGAWTVQPLDYSRRWKFLYSSTRDQLFTRTAVGFLAHARLQYDFDRDPIDFMSELPHDAVPIEV